VARWFGKRDLPQRWPYARDPSKRVLGWQDTADAVAAVVRNASAELGVPVFLIANNYQTAAILDFYLPDDLPVIRPDPSYPPVHCIENPLPQNQFSFWPRYDGRAPGAGGGLSPFAGMSALYITDDPRREGAPDAISRAFDATEVTGVIEVLRRGQPLREIRVIACYDYHGLPL
jgi:hypothetical protein